MNSKTAITLALTSAFVVIPTTGCTNAGASTISSASAGTASAKKAHDWARKAEKEFAKGHNDKALNLAEAAVEADPQNRDYRALLARIYLDEGRFASAERTLMDVMELGQVDARTVITLALTRIGQGKVDSAVSLVEANRSIIPASDYGLTLALAGQTSRAVEVLGDAIRADNVSARTRQNLALAYALDGRWREARIMASQDMSEDRVNERITEWAQYARPGAYQVRVAGLLGVTPQTDDGQPVRLALNAVPGAPMMAAAEVPAPVYAPAPVELAAIGAAPSSDVAGFSAVEQDVRVAAAAPVYAPAPRAAVEAPLIKAPQGPAKSAVAVAASAPKVAAPKPVKPVKLALAEEATKTAPARAGGTHLVQLGAFSSAVGAQDAWSKYQKKFGLQSYSSASSTATVGGRKLVRLAAAGFDNAKDANAVCRAIKAKGGDCVVKSLNGGTPETRLASAKGRQVASR